MKKVLYVVGAVLLFGLGLLIGMMIPKKCPPKCVLNDECKKEKCIANTVSYYIFDGHAPGTAYDVRINLETKEAWVKEMPGCSALECNVHDTEAKTILTDEEFEKVKKVLEKMDINDENKQRKLKSTFAAALSNIALDTGVMVDKEKNPDDYEKYYKDDDLNNDGIVTFREFGSGYLDLVIEEMDELANAN